MKRFFKLTWIFLTLPIRRRQFAEMVGCDSSAKVELFCQRRFGISFWEMAVRLYDGDHPFQ